MNLYFIGGLLSNIVGPWMYTFIYKNNSLAQFLDGMFIATLLALVSFYIMPESLEHLGSVSIFTFLLGLIGPLLISKIFKTHTCEIQKPFLLITILGLAVHNMLDGAALVTHPLEKSSSHMLSLAIVIHRVLEAMAIWGTAYKAVGKKGAVLSLIAMTLSMVIGYFAAGYFLVDLDFQVFHHLQSLACGMLFHVILHPHHLKNVGLKKGQSLSKIFGQRPFIGASFGMALALLIYFLWPVHSHDHHHDKHTKEHHEGHHHE